MNITIEIQTGLSSTIQLTLLKELTREKQAGASEPIVPCLF